MKLSVIAILCFSIHVAGCATPQKVDAEIQLNENKYFVKDLTSANGSKYIVGYPKAAGYDEGTLKSELRNAKKQASDVDANWIDVNWPVNFNSSNLNQAVVDIGINQASLAHCPPNGCFDFYKYHLTFHNTTGWGFQFKDATGDVYSIETILNRTHFINYDSEQPTIVGVRLCSNCW